LVSTNTKTSKTYLDGAIERLKQMKADSEKLENRAYELLSVKDLEEL
jgi:hypothetical protein